MKKLKIIKNLLLALLLLPSSIFLLPSESAELIPMGDFRILGGQYFFNTNPSSLSGNMSFTFVPAVKFSDKFTLVNTYLGSYRGTKEVSDLAGGGTLFQDGQNHFVSVKGVYLLKPELKLKLGTSYRMELLRETKDEMWGKGLFDYNKLNIGVEGEYTYQKKYSARLGIDQYSLAFPNYQSLESQQTTDLGRELAGKNTLNSDNLMILLDLRGNFNFLKAGVIYGSTAKNYPEQPLVLSDSSLSTDKRKDAYTTMGLNVTSSFRIMQGVVFIPVVDYQSAANDSTQAHYDARKTKYTADYYDYTYTAVTPALNFILGSKPWAVTLSGSSGRQVYKERLVQDTDGNYAAEKIYVDENIYGIGVVYPVVRNIKLRMLYNYIDSKSNMKYEKSYSYNYISSNYLMGFNLEF
ncbi:MAG: hypothetical protein ABII64_04495 [Elusimicrobiota bacterium]